MRFLMLPVLRLSDRPSSVIFTATPRSAATAGLTPISSSWMNLVERWSADLTRRKLRRSAHHSVTELKADIRKCISECNGDRRPFIWPKTADEILETLAEYLSKISGG